MYSNLKLRANKICRTCMCETTDIRPLFNKTHGEDQTIADMINFITNLDVKINDKLPKQVCGECEVILSKSAAFKQRCIENDAILKGTLDDCSQHTNSSIIENSHIKHEKSSDTECSSLGQPFQCSVCLEKYSKLSELESHVHNSHNVNNETIFNIPLKTNSDINIDAPVAFNEIIKEEALEHYQNQNDYSNDSNDNNVFETEIEYKQEDEIIIEESSFSCSCGLIFDTEDTYKMHIKTDCKIYKGTIDKDTKLITEIQKQKFVCLKCNMEISTLKAYKTHQRKHKNESNEDKEREQFQCSMCMRKFTKKSSLTAHIKKHEAMANVKYTCNTCKREFKHKAHLDNHISVHTRDKKFSCEYCMKNYTTQKNLDEHIKSHKIDKKHQCKICNKVFCMLSTLTDHIRTHTGEKPFLCSTCGRGFSQKTNLVQHMRRHQGLKPFKCESCDQRFVSKGELVAHNRKHSGAHPFVCDDCGNGFTTSSSLVKHRRIHTGERPYACDLCSMKFAASGTLKNHRRTHTGEKPFQCSYCEKAFVQKHDLVSHIRCHTGERPYVCSTCGQSFRKASALKTHVKVHIKEPLQLQRDMNLSVLQGVNVLLGGMQCDVGNN